MSWLITGSQKVNWDPSLISTALWLDAADNTTVFSGAGTTQATNGAGVQQWNDKSGNGFHLSQSTSGNRPTYATSLLNSKNVITFASNSSQALDRAGGAWGTSYIVMAVARTNLTAADQAIFAARSTSVAAPVNPQLSIDTANNSAFIIRDDSSVIAVSSTATMPLNSWTLLGGQRNGNAVTHYRNGTPSATGTAASPLGTISNTHTTVGGRYGGNFSLTGFLSGNIAEVIVAPISALERIEGYLAHKWGLTANLPSDHPYKVNVPTP